MSKRRKTTVDESEDNTENLKGIGNAESKENNDESLPSGETFKAGQKYATPSPGNGDRVFYETLLTQRPDSEMAQEWCVYYGVLSNKDAEKYYDIILKRKKKSNNSPMKK